MRNEKLEKLLARQQALKETIRGEIRAARARKQKALFGAVQRAGLLDLSDDQIETALKAYQAAKGTDSNGGETS